MRLARARLSKGEAAALDRGAWRQAPEESLAERARLASPGQLFRGDKQKVARLASRCRAIGRGQPAWGRRHRGAITMRAVCPPGALGRPGPTAHRRGLRTATARGASSPAN